MCEPTVARRTNQTLPNPNFTSVQPVLRLVSPPPFPFQNPHRLEMESTGFTHTLGAPEIWLTGLYERLVTFRCGSCVHHLFWASSGFLGTRFGSFCGWELRNHDHSGGDVAGWRDNHLFPEISSMTVSGRNLGDLQFGSWGSLSHATLFRRKRKKR